MSSSGKTIGHGNLVEAKAMLKKAGNTIAASQSRVFHFRRFFLPEFFIVRVLGACGRFGSRESCENAGHRPQALHRQRLARPVHGGGGSG